eukprot:TRINITY_DN1400_c0_g1_i1.p1 TRINITY_DN1400_c0_g1~~TRINITY_DN1400_c0_g1_i1.p1  ORF type:complete len:268 (+),score=44.88 TRINITY_DN1400_c0_g1_i1:2-805(+)
MEQKTPTPSTSYGNKEFTPEERENVKSLLQRKLAKEHLATRPGAGGVVFTYVESYKAIEIANAIFGFNGWSSSVVDINTDFIEQDEKGRFRVGITAVVKVTLKDGTSHEDVGYGICENPKKGIALENAKKEAVTDARKRALRLFGNALGNCLYDRGHVKRIKTVPPNAQGFLPTDTTDLSNALLNNMPSNVDYHNNSNTQQLQQMGVPNGNQTHVALPKGNTHYQQNQNPFVPNQSQNQIQNITQNKSPNTIYVPDEYNFDAIVFDG